MVHRATATLSYRDICRMEPVQQIALIRAGVPAQFAQQLLRNLDGKGIGLDERLKLTRKSLARLANAGRPLPKSTSERIVELARLVGQVESMVEESGDPEGFNSSEWLSSWLDQPLPALAACRPVEYLDTITGMHFVSEILGQMQSGAYA